MTTVTPALRLRVRVQEAWNEVHFELPEETTVEAMKARALAHFRIRRGSDETVVKFRGAEIIDETQTLAQAGIVPNAALIVLPRRRRPVR